MRRVITDADRQAVADLAASGQGRNAIATATGLAPATVSKIAQSLGLGFARARTAAAAAAKQVDNRARRAALESALLDDAERLRGQLFAPCTVYGFGGMEYSFASAVLDRPDARSQRDIMSAVGVAVSSSLRIAAVDSAPDADAARSMLGALMTGLQAAHATLAGGDES
jgi:hypothetical protein